MNDDDEMNEPTAVDAAEGCTMFFGYAAFLGVFLFHTISGLFNGGLSGMFGGIFKGMFLGFFVSLAAGIAGFVIFWLFLALEILIRKIF